MNAPFVWVPFVLSNGVYQPQLQVAWPLLQGIPVSSYEVYADGGSPIRWPRPRQATFGP